MSDSDSCRYKTLELGSSSILAANRVVLLYVLNNSIPNQSYAVQIGLSDDVKSLLEKDDESGIYLVYSHDLGVYILSTGTQN